MVSRQDFPQHLLSPKFIVPGSYLVILVCMLVLRLWKLDQFVTVDEPKWLTRSANFLLAVRSGDWESTYQKEHPGVTIMWIGAAGHIWAGHGVLFLNEAYFIKPADLESFLISENESALGRLTKGRIVQVFCVTALTLLAYSYAVRLFGWQMAMLGFLFVALDPFLIAHQRLLHLDGLLSACLLLSVLAWTRFLYQDRHVIDLLVSAVSAGFGLLTKSPALIAVPVIGLMGAISLPWFDKRASLIRKSLILLRDGSLWLLILMFTFTIFWPAVWIHPIETVSNVISGAIGYAGSGHESAIYFNGKIYTDQPMPWYFYPTSYIWRSSPIVLLGLILAFVSILPFKGKGKTIPVRRNISPLILFAIIYTAVMTFGNKQFDRYILPIFAPLDLVAGFGYWFFSLRFATRLGGGRASDVVIRQWKRVVGLLLVALGIGWTILQVLLVSPYFFPYYNPILKAFTPAERMMMVGWGEGLDEAARYLNQDQQADRLRVLSWYPEGAFSYFFTGETNRTDMPPDIKNLPNVHYVVLYQHQFQRNLPSSSFLEYFESIEPEYTVVLNGINYAFVYRIPDSAFDSDGDFTG